jgi:hypothetical protein
VAVPSGTRSAGWRGAAPTFDHELKTPRAFEDLKELGTRIQTRNSEGHYTTRQQCDLKSIELVLADAEGGSLLAHRVFIPPHKEADRSDEPPWGVGSSIVYATAEEPPNDLFGVIIGEILHNLRSGLDNLVFALASAFTKPLPDDVTEQSEFPIFGDANRRGVPGCGPTLSRDNGRKKIRGWNPLAQAVVEGLQSYQRGSRFPQDQAVKSAPAVLSDGRFGARTRP